MGAPPSRLLDLGSGAGLPGLVLAWSWPDAEVVLLEANARRGAALESVIGRVGWGERVRVVVDRAETRARMAGFRGAFPVVVARSFGAPAVTAECGAGFLRVGGILVVSDPPQARPAGSDPPEGGSPRWPAAELAGLGLRRLRGCDAPQAHFTVLTRTAEVLDDAVPRRDGVPARRPRWR